MQGSLMCFSGLALIALLPIFLPLILLLRLTGEGRFFSARSYRERRESVSSYISLLRC